MTPWHSTEVHTRYIRWASLTCEIQLVVFPKNSVWKQSSSQRRQFHGNLRRIVCFWIGHLMGLLGSHTNLCLPLLEPFPSASSFKFPQTTFKKAPLQKACGGIHVLQWTTPPPKKKNTWQKSGDQYDEPLERTWEARIILILRCLLSWRLLWFLNLKRITNLEKRRHGRHCIYAMNWIICMASV